MAGVGACGSRISREHFISRAILESFSTLNVEGLRGTLDGESKQIGLNSVVSKVLCAEHNSRLSPLDADAAEFFKRLRGLMEGRAPDLNTEWAVREQGIITTMHSGDLLERWMLKAGCGVLAGAVVDTAANLGRGWRPLSEWAEAIAGHRVLNAPLGLYVLQADTETPMNSSRVQLSPVTDANRGDVLGFQITLSWARFFLNLSNDTHRLGSVLEGAVWRPRGLYLQEPGNEAMTYLWWPAESSQNEVSVRPQSSLETD